MIHLDRVERTILRAKATTHANININRKLSRVGDRPPGVWIVGTHNPDALRRAYFGADTTRCATILNLAFTLILIHKKRDEPEFFRYRQLFFGILHRKDTPGILAGTVSNTLWRVVTFATPAEIIRIGSKKVFQGNDQTLQNS